MTCLMVVGAHAFDAEAMAGGLVARWTREGMEARLLHLTRGERGNPSKDPEEYGRQLEDELVEAASRLGATGSWLGFRGGAIDAGKATDMILTEIRRCAPAVMITHWRGSWHERHVQTHDVVRKAVRAFRTHAADAKTRQPVTLWYGENFEDLEGFRPTRYVEMVEQDADRWRLARAAYSLYRAPHGRGPQGEPIQFPYEHYYEAIPRVRGMETGVEERKLFPADVSLAQRFA